MATRTVIAVLGCLSLVAGFAQLPLVPNTPCPCPQDIIEQVGPAMATIGPKPPLNIEHHAAPYEINYFGKPWIINHKNKASLKVFTQTPVVVDEYEAPIFNEIAAPPAVIVEQVCASPEPVVCH